MPRRRKCQARRDVQRESALHDGARSDNSACPSVIAPFLMVVAHLRLRPARVAIAIEQSVPRSEDSPQVTSDRATEGALAYVID